MIHKCAYFRRVQCAHASPSIIIIIAKSGRFHRNGANEMSRNRRSIDHKGNHYYYIIQRLQANSNGTHFASGSSWMRPIDICICKRKLEKGATSRPAPHSHSPKKGTNRMQHPIARITCRGKARNEQITQSKTIFVQFVLCINTSAFPVSVVLQRKGTFRLPISFIYFCFLSIYSAYAHIYNSVCDSVFLFWKAHSIGALLFSLID